MPTNAKIILDTRSYSKKKGGHPISIYVSNRGARFISLRMYSEEKHWNGTSVKTNHPRYREIHQELLKRSLNLVKEVEFCNSRNMDLNQSVELISKGIDDTESRIFLLEQELRLLKGENETKLLEFWDSFILECQDKGLSTEALELSRDQVSNYLLGKDMLINDINYEFLNEFSTYKLRNGCERGGLNHYLATFRRVFLAAQKIESLHIKSGNPFSGFISNSRDGDIVMMTVKEMKAFTEFSPNKFTYESNAKKILRKRDMWLFQFYIGGHDFIDISLLEWKKNIRAGRIRFKRHKNRRHPNGGPMVDNLLVPQALEIIEKYGTKNSDRVFSFLPNPGDKVSYDYNMANTRRALRKISEACELSDVMKTKSTRYIFKTWSDELQLHDTSIKQIQGHSKEGMAARYGGRLPNKVIDEVLTRIVDRINEPEKLGEKAQNNLKSLLNKLIPIK